MYLVFDIGGTKMRMAFSQDGHSLEKFKSINTPVDFGRGLEILTDYFENIKSPKLKGVSVAIPGVFDKHKTKIVKCKNLMGWVNKPIKKEIDKLFESNSILSNDAKMAGLGEAVYGAGIGKKVVAYLTISTGVGGARVVDGKIPEDSLTLEPGHQIIDADSSIDPEFIKINNRYGHGVGTLERFISGKDLALKHKKPLEEIVDIKVWTNIAKYLAIGIDNVIVFWKPDIVVLGGGVAMSDRLKLEEIDKFLDEYLTLSVPKPILVKSNLGDSAALYGGLELLRQKV